jgi:glycosyltransferase involved in cell wall biosynthesis
LRILFVGDEAIRKGIGDLCRAVEMFGAHRCEIRVAGNTDLSALGQREAGKTVNFLGPVPRQEMQYQYEWADVVLLPSVSDTFGLVVLEAMSHGVPVITTHNTGGADVVIEGKNGFVVPVMRPDLIARKLEILDSDPYLLAAFSERAIGCSLDFSLDRYAERLTSVVQSAFVNRLAGSHSPCLALSQQASGTPSKF